MPQTEDLGSFFQETKNLTKEYVETRIEIYRLMLIRAVSRSAGYIIWVIVAFVLLTLLLTFFGLTTGFWLSEVTGSHIKGFGITALLIVAVIIIVALLRKRLFVNPIVRNMIHKIHDDEKEKE